MSFTLSKPRAGDLVACAAAALAGCYAFRAPNGGGMASFDPPRRIDPGSISLPDGYRIEVVARELTFPTGVAFDLDNRPYVVEAGYCYGEVFTKPRVLRVDAGRLEVVAEGADDGPWTGIVHDGDALYVAAGGVLHGGRLLRISEAGEIAELIGGLPSLGDHHVNGPALGPDGRLYFGIGTATNSAIVGPDNADFGWLERHPQFHDVPGADVRLAGRDFESQDRRRGRSGTARTGAFSPYGTPTRAGQVVEGRTVCSGSVLRIGREGGEPELVAWGFRNPFGLAFDAEGRLYVTDNLYDERGSRPVWGAPDLLWRVEEGRWYGWPDYVGGRPIQDEHFRPPDGEKLERVLAEDPGGPPPMPIARFPCHSSADGFAIAPAGAFGHEGDAFVALFGDQVPATGKVHSPVGFKVVRVELETGIVEDFAVNAGSREGPATRVHGRGLERPVAVAFDRTGEALYVVDFGVLTLKGNANEPRERTGVLWKITRKRPAARKEGS